MSEWSSTTLKSATDDSGDTTLDQMSSTAKPHVFSDDWRISACDGPVEDASGPYEKGDVVEITFEFSGAGDNFPAIKSVERHYNIDTANKVSLNAQIGQNFDFNADTKGTATVGISFRDDGFNHQATNYNTELQVSFEIVGVKINITDISKNASNEIEVTFEVKTGTANFSSTLDADYGQNGSFTQVDSKTHSTFTETLVDSNPQEKVIDYKVTTTDADGDSDSDTQTFDNSTVD